MPVSTLDPLWKLLGYDTPAAAKADTEQHLRAAPAPSLLGSLFQGAKDYVEHYSPAAMAARFVEARTPSASDYDPYRNTSADKLDAARKARVVKQERDWRQQAAGRAADIASQDSTAKHIARKAAEIVGGAAGGLVSDPTSLIAPTKFLPSVGVSAGEDLLQQAGEKAEGVRDSIDPTEVGLSAVTGGALPAILHVAERLRGQPEAPVVTPEAPADTSDLDRVLNAPPTPEAITYGEPHQFGELHPADKIAPTPDGLVTGNGMNDREYDRYRKAYWQEKQRQDAEKPSLFTSGELHPDGTIHLNYIGDGNDIPIKLGIEPNGIAEIAVNQFGTAKNKLGPAKIREALTELQSMYPEIKGFAGYRRSGANPGRVQEISAVREGNGPTEFGGPGNEVRVITPNGVTRVPSIEGARREALRAAQNMGLPEDVRSAIMAHEPGTTGDYGPIKIVEGNWEDLNKKYGDPVTGTSFNQDDPNYPPMMSGGGNELPPGEPPSGGGGDNGNAPPGGYEPGFGPNPNEDFTGSINRKKLNTTPEAEQALKAAGEELPIGKETRGWEETNQRADDLNQNTDNFVDDTAFEQLPEKVRAGQRGVRSAWENVIDQGRKAIGSDDYNKALADAVAVTTRHSQNVGSVGRGLNILKEPLEGSSPLDAESLKAIGKFASNPDNAARLQELIEKHIDDAEALRKIARDLRKPRFTDYIKSAAYNAMLSGPATQSRNILGNLANLYGDIGLHGLSAVGGQGKKLWSESTDRVMGREVLARLYGSYAGALQGLRNFKAAYREASPLDIAYREGGGSPFHSKTAMVLEAATRTMAAADEVARMMALTSDIYGQATRKAVSEGESGWGKGSNLWDRVDDIVADPDKEMLKSADDYARLMRFQDEPGWVAGGIEKMLRDNPKDVPPKALAKLVTRLTILPFVRTPSSIIRTAARNSPLGVLSSRNWEDFKAGGARRDMAVTRVAAGTALTSGVAMMASSGDITGLGPEDWRKNAELQASGWRPNSVKVGDKYVSYDNLGPLSVLLSSTATAVERLKAGELKGESYANVVGDASLGVADAMLNNGWMESLANFFGAMTGPAEQREAGLTNTAAGVASSMTVPALIRQINQNYVDPVSRETKGNGTAKDRIENRVATGVPGLSDNLPARHSPYGDEIVRHAAGGPLSILNPVTESPETTDPAEKELARLSATDPTGKALVAPVPTNIRLPGGVNIKLNGEDYQLYQAVTGDYVKIGIGTMMEDPDWNKLSDDSKRAIVKSLMTKARKTARTIVEMKAIKK